MAISRIGGKALRANLERDSNLAFNTNTLYVDYTNGRIGIGKTNPAQILDVTGNVNATGTVTANAFAGDGSSLTNIGTDLVNDTTPQLGGNLDLNSKSVTGVLTLDGITIDGNKIGTNDSNANVDIVPSGTGALNVRSNATITGTLGFSTGVTINKILDEDAFGINDASLLSNNQIINISH